jgi:hypothetical protein
MGFPNVDIFLFPYIFTQLISREIKYGRFCLIIYIPQSNHFAK